MKLSIVVPVLNERKLLPRLIDSIAAQDFDDYELIIADAGSTDGTIEIARDAGAIIVPGGLPGAGRNSGAKEAKGEYVFFFDADVVLPPKFLKNAIEELDDRFIDLATCEIRPISNYWVDLIIHRLLNISIRSTVRMDARAFGFAIFTTRRLYRRAGGFDESIRLGEDAEFVKRASQFRSLHWLNSAHLYVSVRRFEKEGRLHHFRKGIRLNIYRTFRGEVRDDQIDYRFGDYDAAPDAFQSKLVERIERRLMKLQRRRRPTNVELMEEIIGQIHEITESETEES